MKFVAAAFAVALMLFAGTALAQGKSGNAGGGNAPGQSGDTPGNANNPGGGGGGPGNSDNNNNDVSGTTGNQGNDKGVGNAGGGRGNQGGSTPSGQASSGQAPGGTPGGSPTFGDDAKHAPATPGSVGSRVGEQRKRIPNKGTRECGRRVPYPLCLNW